jgi:hypothetical protein
MLKKPRRHHFSNTLVAASDGFAEINGAMHSHIKSIMSIVVPVLGSLGLVVPFAKD